MTRKPVKQRHGSDCAIAAVANAAGITYKAVKERFGRIDPGGLTFHEIQWIAAEFGLTQRIRVRKRQSIKEWVVRHARGTYVLVLDEIFTGHAVAVVDGTIHGHFIESSAVTMVLTRPGIKNKD